MKNNCNTLFTRVNYITYYLNSIYLTTYGKNNLPIILTVDIFRKLQYLTKHLLLKKQQKINVIAIVKIIKLALSVRLSN